MSVLVTGGQGFIGRQIVSVLVDQGVNVLAPPDRDTLDVAAGRFPDVAVETVYHLAALNFVPQSWKHPADYYRVNTLGTVNVLDYCRRHGAALVFVSAYCYGLPESLPINESARLKPNNPYAFSKAAAEEACRFFSMNYGIGVSILRPFNVYGPGQNERFLIPSLIQQALDPTAEAIVVTAAAPRRDYIYLDDVVRAIVSVPVTSGRINVYNVGSGVSHSVEEVAELVCQAAGLHKPTVEHGPHRKDEISDTVADISAIRRDLGWNPKVSLECGLSLMVANARQHHARSSSVRPVSR